MTGFGEGRGLSNEEVKPEGVVVDGGDYVSRAGHKGYIHVGNLGVVFRDVIPGISFCEVYSLGSVGSCSFGLVEGEICLCHV